MKSTIQSIFNNLGFDIRKIQKVSPIQTFESQKKLSHEIIEKIFDFYKKIPPFYDLDTPKPLQIAGMWKGILEKGRVNQLNYILRNNKKDYRELQEKMFFNELIEGLWNYSYYNQNTKNCTPKFLEECLLFEKITSRKTEELVTNNSWSCWGLVTEKGIVKYVDPSHGISAFHILTLLDNTEINEKIPMILDLGSGYGGLAEKIMVWAKNSLNICLIDIPLNLTIAYAYLVHIFGEDRVTLISSKDELAQVKIKDKSGRFVLIPTIFVPHLTPYFEFDIVHNAHSFSEMDLPTITYYLEHLVTDNVSYIIDSNVNVSGNVAEGHLEVRCTDFPIPKSHKLLTRFSDGIQSRHVTSIHKNTRKV